MTVTFKSNFNWYGTGTSTGFLAIWTATSEPPTYPTPIGCDSCTFPFKFGDTAFDTCISVDDVDIQPWCSSLELPNYTPPSSDGTHTFSSPKISCFDSDSSCPSTPTQILITSPNYPQQYPLYFDKVHKKKIIRN